MSGLPPQLDPRTDTFIVMVRVYNMMFDTLIQRDWANGGALVTGLATSWTQIDETTLELKLREGVTILFEAALSFLGLGVPPPQPSWRSMINGGRDYLLSAWWISVIPGIALMLTVLTVSLIGDWIRDVLDPTLRNLRRRGSS